MILLQKTRHSVTSKSEEESGGLRVLTLTSWIPRLKKGKFYIEGDLKDVDNSIKDRRSFESSRYKTSSVVRRISARVLATKNKERKKRLYVLEGILAEEENNNPRTPHFIMEKFKFGFPDNWENIVKHWIRIEAQNSKNYLNMSGTNSSMQSNLSNCENNETQLTNSSTNSSGFIHSRLTNLSTTVDAQTDIPDLTMMRTDLRRSSNDIAATGEVPAYIPHVDLPEDAEDIITAPDRDAGCAKDCCLRAYLLYRFCDVCMFNDIQINTSDICCSVIIVQLGDQVGCPAGG